ncbi:MAG: hypothetical protein ABI199_02270, partial [Bacteroidia bacterium]
MKKKLPKKSTLLIFAILFALSNFVGAQETSAQKNVTKTAIPADFIFAGADSLAGFNWSDYYAYLNKSKGAYINPTELRFYLRKKERRYVRKKYSLPIPPPEKTATINPNNYTVLTSACNNVDFEDGNFTGWTGFKGYNGNSNAALTTTATGIFNGALNNGINTCQWHTLESAAAGNDPYGNFPMLDPAGGTYAARIGGPKINQNILDYNCGTSADDPSSDSKGEILQQTFPVSSTNALFTYKYAVVLNDGGHPNGEQPYFKIEVYDQSNNPIPCLQFYVQAASGVPPAGFLTSAKTNSEDGSTVYYLPWTTNSLNLSAYVGQNVTVRFTAAGCTQGGHFGYGYIDCSCSKLQIIVPGGSGPCLGSTTTLTAPAGASTYSWVKVPPGPGIVAGASSQTATVNQSGTYKVTITTSTGCSYSVDTNVVFVPPPTVTVSPNANICTGGSGTTLTASGAVTYSWSPSTGLSATTGSSVTATPASSTTYTVIGTSGTGCTGSASVTVTVNPKPTVTVSASTSICNGSSTILTSGGATTYSWSPGTGLSSTTGSPVTASPAATTTYTVTGTSASGCTNSASVTVT